MPDRPYVPTQRASIAAGCTGTQMDTDTFLTAGHCTYEADAVAIWSQETKYKIWFEIEAHATSALAKLGVVPQAAADALWAWWATKPEIDVAAIDAIEAVTKHDVIAFLTWVAEQVGEEARFMHQGMTSSDVLDTCLSVQLVRATDLLLADMDALLAAIKVRAFEHKFTPTMGRSHGIHAEPVTFGFKLAQAYAEFERCRARLVAARAEIATCAISGAVGTFANIDPAVEAYVAEQLGLKPETISTQVIPRDRHAMYFATLGVIASEVPGPVGEEFKAITERIKIGKTMEDALQDTANRLNMAEFSFFCITLAIQRETGGNLAETLSNLADVLRDAPGVYAQKKWGGDIRLSIRGSGIGNAVHNRGVLLAQDGVPFNEADGFGDFQLIDPLIAAAEGALAPAHRGLAYAVFEDLPLETFGNRIPSLTFEVIADEEAVPMGWIAR